MLSLPRGQRGFARYAPTNDRGCSSFLWSLTFSNRNTPCMSAPWCDTSPDACKCVRYADWLCYPQRATQCLRCADPSSHSPFAVIFYVCLDLRWIDLLLSLHLSTEASQGLLTLLKMSSTEDVKIFDGG